MTSWCSNPVLNGSHKGSCSLYRSRCFLVTSHTRNKGVFTLYHSQASVPYGLFSFFWYYSLVPSLWCSVQTQWLLAWRQSAQVTYMGTGTLCNDPVRSSVCRGWVGKPNRARMESSNPITCKSLLSLMCVVI